MGDALIRSLSSCASFVQNIKTQVHEISQIKTLMNTHFKAFSKALNNMNNALNIFEGVFIPNSPHNVLFQHKILSFSQIDTIEVKLEPINDLFSLLGSLQSTEDYCDKLSIYWELYLAHKKPATLKRRLKQCFKIVEELLPLINDLNLTIFGSAQRITHPILKKAWMLAGQNQLNDSSLSKNILQDNLYMLLKLEIDESSINRQKKQMYKGIIRRIVTDIDNRGASEGDGHISIAELNDLPDEVLHYNISQSDDNISNKQQIYNYDYDNNSDDDDDDDDYEYSKLKKEISFSSPSRYFCFFKKGLRISPGGLNESDKNESDKNESDKNESDKNEPECDLNNVPNDTIILATDFLDRYRQYWKDQKNNRRLKQDAKKQIINENNGTSNVELDKATENNDTSNVELDKTREELSRLSQMCIETGNKLKIKTQDMTETVESDEIENIIQPKVIDIIMDIPYEEGNPQMYWNYEQCNSEDAITRPHCVADYGHDFPYRKLVTIPINSPSTYESSLNDNKHILTNICFNMVVFDQGWGGTGSVHVRYQINDGKCIKAFTVLRESKKKRKKNNRRMNMPKNTYKFNINGYELNKNKKNRPPNEPQTISIWLFCPPKKGWTASVKSIKCEHRYN